MACAQAEGATHAPPICAAHRSKETSSSPNFVTKGCEGATARSWVMYRWITSCGLRKCCIVTTMLASVSASDADFASASCSSLQHEGAALTRTRHGGGGMWRGEWGEGGARKVNVGDGALGLV